MKHKEHCIILAAGASSRMGTNKMLLPWKNTTVLGQVIGNVIEAGMRPCLVLGNKSEEIRDNLHGYVDAISVAMNPHWQDGMLSSIQTGMRALDSGDAYILHGDMPLVSGKILRSIADKFAQADYGDYDALFPSYEGKSGHPVLIRFRLFTEILGLPPAEKLHPFLKTRKWLAVEFPYPEACIDIDTAEAYSQYHP